LIPFIWATVLKSQGQYVKNGITIVKWCITREAANRPIKGYFGKVDRYITTIEIANLKGIEWFVLSKIIIRSQYSARNKKKKRKKKPTHTHTPKNPTQQQQKHLPGMLMNTYLKLYLHSESFQHLDPR
jgi:hypothetical protein